MEVQFGPGGPSVLCMIWQAESGRWSFFFTGRLRGLGFALLHAIGLFGVALLAFLLAGYLIYGNAWFGRFQ